jgi:hypothetical protein
MDSFDPVSFVAGTVRPMAEHTFPFVCSIVGIENEREGQHVGSAIRVATSEKRLLVTAGHVLKSASEFPQGGGIVRTRGEAPTSLAGRQQFADDESDLAVVFLEGPEEVSANYFPVSLFDGDRTARTHDYLFIHGFPGERARFLFGESHHRSLPYGVMERDDDLPVDMKDFEFAMDYDPKNMRLESGVDASLVMPPGLSGSPVWRIGAYNQRPETWAPSASRLVGVVTRWNQERRVLLAAEIAHVLALIERIA